MNKILLTILACITFAFPAVCQMATSPGNDGASTHQLTTDTTGVLTIIEQGAAGDGRSNAASGFFSVKNGANGSGVPALVYPFWFNGASWDRQSYCTTSAPITVTGTSDTQIVALTASQIIRICDITVTLGGTAPTMTVEYGTGTNCATGKTALTGAMAPNTGTNLSINPGPMAALRSGSGAAVCLVLAGTSPTANGFISFAKY